MEKLSVQPAQANLDWSGYRGQKWQRYLQLLEATLKPVNQPLFELLQPHEVTRLAEIGSGGGGTALELLERLKQDCQIDGYDISSDLVKAAQARIPRDERRLRFYARDVGQSLPKQSYQGLLGRFSLMFFSDPLAALHNLRRWLEPEGRFVFAVWGRPENNLWMSSVRQIVSEVATLPKMEPEAPGPFRYADADSFHSLLAQAGFTGVQRNTWHGKLEVGGGLSADEAAGFALSSFGQFAEMLEQGGEQLYQEALRRLIRHWKQNELGGRVSHGAEVHIFTGRAGSDL